MLAAFLDIKPRDSVPFNVTPTQPSVKQSKPPKQPKQSNPKQPKQSNPKQPKKQPKAPVEAYGGSAMHAQFKPSVQETEPWGMAGACVADCEMVGEGFEDGACDPYEYLLQDANHAECEEDDTSSCLTADDALSDVSHVSHTSAHTLSSSPVGTSFEGLDRSFFSKRKAKASEVPVYTGPELWFEDEDFIE